MGVRTLIGTADGGSHAAAMFDSSSGWAFGPVFEAEDAEDQIEAFVGWLSSGGAFAVRAELRLESPVIGDGRDPREWPDAALKALIGRWRSDFVGADGWLLDTFECACGKGHHHLGEDGGTARSGECAACPCVSWEPGNRGAELAAAHE
jgi:hypothetical protein